MNKMSLERFLEIKEILSIVPKVVSEEVELDDETYDKIEEITDEIKHSDLSDIPAEAYEGFYDIGFDFEGTGANLDFSIINEEFRENEPLRVKGCNVKNVDFENIRYDEDSFDENFARENNLKFWGMTEDLQVPREVRERYMEKRLTIEDMVTYNLFEKVPNSRLSYEAKEIMKRIPIEIITKIDLELLNFLKRDFESKLEESEKKIETLEDYDEIMKDVIIERLSKGYFRTDYEKLIKFSKVREYAPEYIIDLPENDESLRNAFFSNDLNIIHIRENTEIFRGKKFINRLYGGNNKPELTEEKIIYMLDTFKEFSDDILGMPAYFLDIASGLDPKKTIEENKQIIRDRVKEFADNKKLSEEDLNAFRKYYSSREIIEQTEGFKREEYDTILKYTTTEKIDEYNLPIDILKNSHVISTFRIFGFETIMEFDRKNGNIFSKNDYQLLKDLYESYLHYASNDHNLETNVLHRELTDDRGTDYDRPFTEEEFSEAVVRMIRKGVWKDGRNQRNIDYRDFSDDFKSRYPNMFLPIDAPDNLKDKFYSATISPSDLSNNQDWIEHLSKIDFSFGMEYTSLKVKTKEDFWGCYLNEFLSNKMDKEESLRFLAKNAKYISLIEKFPDSSYYGIHTLEMPNDIEDLEVILKTNLINGIFEGKKEEYTLEQKMMYIEELGKFDPEHINIIKFGVDELNIENPTREDFEKHIKEQIVKGMIAGRIKYGPDNYPDFAKEEYPELFIDDNAPEDLKVKFYSSYISPNGHSSEQENLNLQNLQNPEYIEFLKGKVIPSAKNEIKVLSAFFSTDEMIRLGSYDIDGLKIYAQNNERAKKLKERLDNYPDAFAKEEIMNGFKLSEEEFEQKIQNDTEIQEVYNKAKEEYTKDIISMPGLFLYVNEEISRQDIRNYRNLDRSNSLKQSPHYRRDIYEQILAHMYGFLGFDEAKKMLEPPQNIEPESLDQIFEIDSRIKDLYEKKFEITGSIKTLSTLFAGFPSLLPNEEKVTSKNTLILFKSLNKKLKEGYNGDVSELLSEILLENNFPKNSEAIESLVHRVVSLHTDMKLDDLREYTSSKIDTEIEENLKTRKRIKQIYRDALKYSLNKSEKVDVLFVRKYLEKEFGRVNEEGEPYYSPHVTEHLEDLLKITQDLNNDPEKSKIANQTTVDSLYEESAKIANRWIMKIAQVSNLPEKLTYEQAIKLDEDIYGKDSEHEVRTNETVGIKELSKEEKTKTYEILRDANYAQVFTYNKAEIMFSGMVPPFSEEFKRYFLEHKQEFIGNSEYYTEFAKMHGKFDLIINKPEIRNRYDEGLFELPDLLNEVKSVTYANVKEGEYELAYISRVAGLTEGQFEIAQRLYAEMLKRESTTIPPEQYTGERFRGRIVRIDDPLHLAVGAITNCCQTIGKLEPGESSMIHSGTENNGSLFVVEELDEKGNPKRIVAQSWTWRNGNRLTFDNVEIRNSIIEEFSKTGGFDEIMEVYEEAAKKIFETDKKALDILLKKGKITQEQYEHFLLKDITMGKGCDDLISNLSKAKKDIYPNFDELVTPLEIDKTYTGSTERSLYTDSHSSIILIAHNDEFDQKDHKFYRGEATDIGIKYTKTRDIFRKRGKDIDPDKISTIKKLVEKTGRNDESLFTRGNVQYMNDIWEKISKYTYKEDVDYDVLSISMSESGDWYVLSEEKENGIIIHDSGIDMTKPEVENERTKIDRKMAQAEYIREMLTIIEGAAEAGKFVVINDEREGKLLPIEKLKESGEIAISSDGNITVGDSEKLKQRISDLTRLIEESRRERIVSDIGVQDKNDSDGR